MKAIIFDCDGVLVDSESVYQGTQHKFLTEMGIDYDPSAYAEKFMGLPTAIYFKAMRDAYEPILGKPFPDDFETRFKQHSYEQISANLTAIDGAMDFVKALKKPYAVASSTHLEYLHQKLHKTGLHSLFDPHIYSGEQVPRGKPFPDLFLFAADRISIEPKYCVVIEDSVNGVKAGVAAGMTVIGFSGGGHCSVNHDEMLMKAGAHKTARSFKELYHLL